MIPNWYQTRNLDGSEVYPLDFYIERMKFFRASPPPDDWDGVFIFETK